MRVLKEKDYKNSTGCWDCGCSCEYDVKTKTWYLTNFCSEHDPTVDHNED